MPYQTGTATDYKDLLDKLRRFVCGYGVPGTPSFTGTGNGTMTAIDTFPASVTETWTVTCITAAANGGVFSVVGSVSGAKADATVGTPYDNTLVKFTLNDGTTDFIVGDAFTLAVTRGALKTAGDEWLEKRWTTGSEYELILQGPGSDGAQQILVGILTYSSVPGDYFNWRLQGYTGYVAGSAFDAQPGAIAGTSSPPRVSLWNSTITYWLVADGNRFAMVAKVSSVYQGCYLGYLRSWATPGQYPYPLFIGGGNSAYTGERWSSAGGDNRMFADPGGYVSGTPYRSSAWVLRPALTWRDVVNWNLANPYRSHAYTWPFRQKNISPAIDVSQIRENLDGTYRRTPVTVLEDAATQVYGELYGVYQVSGYGRAAEDIVQVGGVDHLVVPNVNRTGVEDYLLLALE